jgi:hypothetical protein
LSVCGLQSVNDPEIFMGYGFKAHLQLVEGFPEWIKEYTSVKMLCFDDCLSIQQTILDEAMSWIKPFYFEGQRILISCAAGESRSVSIAICAISLFESMEFYDACKVVFKAIPRAYWSGYWSRCSSDYSSFYPSQFPYPSNLRGISAVFRIN